MAVANYPGMGQFVAMLGVPAPDAWVEKVANPK
jgi:hypothetical protein